MKTKHRKTLTAIFAKPTKANIRFADIESLLVSLGGKVIAKGPVRACRSLFPARRRISTVRILARKRKNIKWGMPMNFCND